MKSIFFGIDVDAAVVNNNKTIVTLLLGKGFLREKCLLSAVKTENLEMAEFLLENGADQNHRMCHWRDTFPLILSAENGRRDFVSLLLRFGPHPTHQKRAIQRAASFGNREIVEFMLQNDCGTAEQALQVSVNHLGMMKFLLQTGANTNVTTWLNERLPNGARRHPDGQSLLHCCGENWVLQPTLSSQLLIDYGADIHALDINGRPALVALGDPSLAGDAKLSAAIMFSTQDEQFNASLKRYLENRECLLVSHLTKACTRLHLPTLLVAHIAQQIGCQNILSFHDLWNTIKTQK